MKKADRYVCPAMFGYGNGEEISVAFPGIDVATSGDSDNDAPASPHELLGLTTAGLEEDGEPIPAPTPLKEVALSADERAVLVDVYMPSIRPARVNRSINRAVTLPAVPFPS